MSASSWTTETALWWAMSAWRMPRSVMMSSHFHGAVPVTQPVPSIMLSKTAVSDEPASPANAVCWRPVRLIAGVCAMSAGKRTGWSCSEMIVESDSSRLTRALCSAVRPGSQDGTRPNSGASSKRSKSPGSR